MRRRIMRVTATALLVSGGKMLAAEAAPELLKRAALFYNGFQTVGIRGEVTDPAVGGSWRVSYEEAAWRIQPSFVHSEVRASATNWIVSVGGQPRLTRATQSAKDDPPPATRGFTAETFGDFGNV